MTLHPEMAAIMAETEALGIPAPDTVPLAVARANFIAGHKRWDEPVPGVTAHDATLGGVACRVVEPARRRPGTVVYAHGGGWTLGSARTHEHVAALLAAGTGLAAVLPDYRLAPEHPAPAAIDDVLSVIAASAAPGPLVLAGDSAGANIVLAAALERRPDFLSLIYGCFAPDFATASHARNGEGFGLTTDRMRWFWRNWQGTSNDPRAAPGHAPDLRNLPPCHLLAAGLDPLLDDSLLLANRLAEAGVPLRLDVVPGVIHGFLLMTRRLPTASVAIAMLVDGINAATAPAATAPPAPPTP